MMNMNVLTRFVSKFFALLLTVSAAFAAEQADVVVVAATPGGIAAAVAAARSGGRVVLIEEKSHVGGIVSAGLTNTDIHRKAAVGGLFAEFVKRVRVHYGATYGEKSEQVKACQGGHMFEAKVAEKIFSEMLAGEKGIRLVKRHRIVSATIAGKDGAERPAEHGVRLDGAAPKDFGPLVELVSVSAEDLESPGTVTEYRAKTFVDATYEGDLAALAGVPYRVGRESRETFGEAHAGKIYLRFKDVNPLPGSTGEADDGIQAFCFRIYVTKDLANAAPVEKPAGYDRNDYRVMLEDMRSGRVIILNKHTLLPHAEREV